MTLKVVKANRAERGCAWAVTFLLTVFLLIALLSSIALQAMTSAGLHLQVANDDSVLERQMLRIYEKIDLLADEYGFSAEIVKAAVSREELAEMNQKAAAWWTRLLTDGEADPFPRWYSGSIEDAVYDALDSEKFREDPRTIVADLTDIIERTVIPLREILLTSGMDLVKMRIDVSGTIRSLQKIPVLCLMMCLVSTGLIALLLGREMILLLRHYGTAMAATGLLIMTVGVIMITLRLRETIAQASGELAWSFNTLMGKINMEGILLSVGLLGIGYACLFLYRNKANSLITPGDQTE